MAIARYTIAVDREKKTENGPTADFVSCVSFGKTAEFIEKYFSKGRRIGAVGSIQTGSYKKDDQTIYTTDVLVNKVYFVDNKSDVANNTTTQPTTNSDEFMNIPDNIDEELPFV